MIIKNKLLSTFVFGFILLCGVQQVSLALKYDFVTWTSTIKLLNVQTNARLHSHDVKYGSGSGQQSVTGTKNADDHNSYWQLIGKANNQVERGQPIKCGETVRLLHVSTKRLLHSHLFHSPLSNNQEVSAFGENGEGDDGDNWIVECDEDYWRRDEPIRLKHDLTKKYLHVTGDTYGRPISGQYEISCSGPPSQLNLWRVHEGIYIKPSESTQQKSQNDDTDFSATNNEHSEL